MTKSTSVEAKVQEPSLNDLNVGEMSDSLPLSDIVFHCVFEQKKSLDVRLLPLLICEPVELKKVLDVFETVKPDLIEEIAYCALEYHHLGALRSCLKIKPIGNLIHKLALYSGHLNFFKQWILSLTPPEFLQMDECLRGNFHGNSSLLFEAALTHDVAVLKTMVALGADPLEKNKKGYNLAHRLLSNPYSRQEVLLEKMQWAYEMGVDFEQKPYLSLYSDEPVFEGSVLDKIREAHWTKDSRMPIVLQWLEEALASRKCQHELQQALSDSSCSLAAKPRSAARL